MQHSSHHQAPRYCALIGAVVLLSAACQTIDVVPERKTSDSTLLIIPLEFKTEGGETPFVFSLNLDDVQDSKTGDLLDFGRSFAFLRDIGPGKHRITRMLVRWKPTGQIVQQTQLDIPFALDVGQALLLPVRFSISVKANRSYFTTYNLLEKDIEEAWTELRTYGNMEGWDIAPLASAGSASAQVEPPAAEPVPEATPEVASQPEPAPPEPEPVPVEEEPKATTPVAKEAALSSSVPAIAAMQEKRSQAEFDAKMQKVDIGRYRLWLEQNGLVETEAAASYTARLEILEEFLTQSRTRGHAVEAMTLIALPFTLRQDRSDMGVGYTSTEQGWGIGATLGWSYQVDTMISIGVNVSVTPYFSESRFYDDLGSLYQESGHWTVFLWLGPSFTFGDKTTSFAGQISIGLGAASELLLPIRLGMYYHNFYVGYLGLIPITDNDYGDWISGLEAGYSIYFGTKRTWSE